jgi:PPM family protein phosphatase
MSGTNEPVPLDPAKLVFATLSDPGRARTENQDASALLINVAGERLAIVADGMGGHRGGETASKLCIDTLGRAFRDPHGTPEERLRRGLELANEEVYSAALSNPDLKGMGTTAVALLFGPGTRGVWLAWVGDSRCYRLRDGALERLTRDHSLMAEWLEMGVIAPADVENHPRKHELTRAIGQSPDVQVEVARVELRAGDRFLLCSDGIHTPVPERVLKATVGSQTPEDAVRALVDRANGNGGPDNATAVVVEVPAAAITADAIEQPPEVALELELPPPKHNVVARGRDPREDSFRLETTSLTPPKTEPTPPELPPPLPKPASPRGRDAREDSFQVDTSAFGPPKPEEEPELPPPPPKPALPRGRDARDDSFKVDLSTFGPPQPEEAPELPPAPPAPVAPPRAAAATEALEASFTLDVEAPSTAGSAAIDAALAELSAARSAAVQTPAAPERAADPNAPELPLVFETNAAPEAPPRAESPPGAAAGEDSFADLLGDDPPVRATPAKAKSVPVEFGAGGAFGAPVADDSPVLAPTPSRAIHIPLMTPVRARRGLHAPSVLAGLGIGALVAVCAAGGWIYTEMRRPPAPAPAPAVAHRARAASPPEARVEPVRPAPIPVPAPAAPPAAAGEATPPAPAPAPVPAPAPAMVRAPEVTPAAPAPTPAPAPVQVTGVPKQTPTTVVIVRPGAATASPPAAPAPTAAAALPSSAGFELAPPVRKFVDDWLRAQATHDAGLYTSLGFRELPTELAGTFATRDSYKLLAASIDEERSTPDLVYLRVVVSYAFKDATGRFRTQDEERMILRNSGAALHFEGRWQQ